MSKLKLSTVIRIPGHPSVFRIAQDDKVPSQYISSTQKDNHHDSDSTGPVDKLIEADTTIFIPWKTCQKGPVRSITRLLQARKDESEHTFSIRLFRTQAGETDVGPNWGTAVVLGLGRSSSTEYDLDLL